MQVTEEAVFPPAKGKVGDGGGDANIDAYVAGFCLVAELARGRALLVNRQAMFP